MGTKNNPGKFDCYAKADPDEPIFILRAKDPLASFLVNLWASFAKTMHEDITEEKINEAKATADEMLMWYVRHKPQLNKVNGTLTLATCICGHYQEQHNVLQDFGPLIKGKQGPALAPEYKHCKECKCPAFQTSNM